MATVVVGHICTQNVTVHAKKRYKSAEKRFEISADLEPGVYLLPSLKVWHG